MANLGPNFISQASLSILKREKLSFLGYLGGLSALAVLAWWMSGISKVREVLELKPARGLDIEVTLAGPIRFEGVYRARTGDDLGSLIRFAGGLEKGVFISAESRKRRIEELGIMTPDHRINLDLNRLVTRPPLEHGMDNGKRKGQRYR